MRTRRKLWPVMFAQVCFSDDERIFGDLLCKLFRILAYIFVTFSDTLPSPVSSIASFLLAPLLTYWGREGVLFSLLYLIQPMTSNTVPIVPIF